MRIFDKSKPTCLATDWSKTRIGFWLYQKQCDCTSTSHWLEDGLAAGSLNCQHHAPVEGEALAAVHALDKAKFFVLECRNLTVGVFSVSSLIGPWTCQMEHSMTSRRKPYGIAPACSTSPTRRTRLLMQCPTTHLANLTSKITL